MKNTEAAKKKIRVQRVNYPLRDDNIATLVTALGTEEISRELQLTALGTLDAANYGGKRIGVYCDPGNQINAQNEIVTIYAVTHPRLRKKLDACFIDEKFEGEP